MTDSAPGRASDFNAKMIEEFRANGGRVGGPWAGTTLILIHHIGARSGTERVTPLGCSLQGDGRFAIVASNGGSPAHPDWYYNLKASPGSRSRWVPRRSRCWRRSWPAPPAPPCGRSWSRYPSSASTSRTTRQIPVFMLTRLGERVS